eukprot:scaffold14699_cov170-Amphora_coffeaeformis.AAC.5
MKIAGWNKSFLDGPERIFRRAREWNYSQDSQMVSPILGGPQVLCSENPQRSRSYFAAQSPPTKKTRAT